MSENEINNIHRRMDNQDKLLLEIRDTLVRHLADDADYKPAMKDLVTLWKASKIIIPAGAGMWAFVVWAKDHIKW